jgi:dynein heavy chain
LIDLFGTILQFKTLQKHNLEGINPIIEAFDKHVNSFRRKNHRLLDYTINTFDRDFVEFNVGVSTVESDLQ